MMQVDAYDLLGVLQTLAYTAGECSAMANMVDSEKAQRTLAYVGGTLKNAADDVRVMFDGFVDGVTCEMEGVDDD